MSRYDTKKKLLELENESAFDRDSEAQAPFDKNITVLFFESVFLPLFSLIDRQEGGARIFCSSCSSYSTATLQELKWVHNGASLI